MPHETSPLPVAGDETILVEQAILAGLLTYPERIATVRDNMLPGEFVEPWHGSIYEALCDQHDKGEVPTISTIVARLGNVRITPDMTLRQYLHRMALEGATTPESLAGNARAVRDAAGMRALQDIAASLNQKMAAGGIVDPMPLALELIERADAIVGQRQGDGSRGMTLGQAARIAIEQAIRAKSGQVEVGIKTGIPALDEILGTMLPGELIVLAGRPAMGKTALALTIALNATRRDKPAIGFSLEMSAVELARRAISTETALMGRPIEYSRIAAGDLDDEEEEIVLDSMDGIDRLPFFIEQQGGLTISQICARARRYVARKRAEGHAEVLIFIDYLSLVKSGDRYKGNRVSEVGEITTALKALAKELECPIILLAQLNRNVESRDDKRPHLADLRESGQIEQDADAVLFVYREEYYLTNTSTDGMSQQELMEHMTRLREAEGIMEIIVGKQRKGKAGIVKTRVDMGCNTVYELARRAA